MMGDSLLVLAFHRRTMWKRSEQDELMRNDSARWQSACGGASTRIEGIHRNMGAGSRPKRLLVGFDSRWACLCVRD